MRKEYKKPRAELLDLQTKFGYMDDIGFTPGKGSPGGEGLHAKPHFTDSFTTDWENEEDDDNTNKTNQMINRL